MKVHYGDLPGQDLRDSLPLCWRLGQMPARVTRRLSKVTCKVCLRLLRAK